MSKFSHFAATLFPRALVHYAPHLVANLLDMLHSSQDLEDWFFLRHSTLLHRVVAVLHFSCCTGVSAGLSGPAVWIISGVTAPQPSGECFKVLEGQDLAYEGVLEPRVMDRGCARFLNQGSWKTPEQPKIKNWGSKCKIWGSLPAQKFPKVQNEGVMNDPKSCQKFEIGSHFCKMCAYDPMSPSSATPGCGRISNMIRRASGLQHHLNMTNLIQKCCQFR